MKQPALPQQALQLSIPKIRQATQEQEQTKELTKEQEMEQDQPNTNPVAIKKSAYPVGSVQMIRSTPAAMV